MTLYDYEQAHAWLLSLITDPKGERKRIRKTAKQRLADFEDQLARTADFLAFLGNPQTRFKSVHVAGTSGKGSVVAMTAALLRTCDLNVGHHISPYLQVCNEKLVADSRMISPSEFVETVADFRKAYEHWQARGGRFTSLRYGEAWVALTYFWLARREVDWAVIETGMGGRYDPTNVLPSNLAVITNVDYDHVESLGPKLADIARHKAGIIKEGSTVLTAARKPQVLQIIQKEAEKQKSQLYSLGRDFDYHIAQLDKDGALISVQAFYHHYDDIHVGMRGVFQPENAALSIAAVDILAERFGFRFRAEDADSALKELVFPGRMEVMQERPLVMLDGAHNPAKMAALVDSLKALYPDRQLTAVVGILESKDARGMLESLSPHVSSWTVTRPHVLGKPSAAPEELRHIIQNLAPASNVQVAENVKEALDGALAQAGVEDFILVTGSLYLVGEARELWHPRSDILRALENT